ncbi:MAG: L-fucose:H+ symporter permease [Chitinophagaceae bacterium]
MNVLHSEFSDQGNDKTKKYFVPLILVTSLFFLWGFAYGILDALNKHFQDVLHITKLRSTLLQAAYFGGYFIMALPAGMIMKKFGYKRGILLGLILYAFGALLFFPSAAAHSYNAFLFSLFILACGLCCLETAANPYVTLLGERTSAAFRLNLAQCFNGVGSFLGPFLAAFIFFGPRPAGANTSHNPLISVQYTYLIMGLVVLGIAVLINRSYLPEVNEEQELDLGERKSVKPLFQNKHFIWGVIAQFFYVAAQVGVAAFFINYATENWKGISNSTASQLLGWSLVLFTLGRFVGTGLMKFIRPHILLTIYSLINIILCVLVIKGMGAFSVFSLMAIFFFESIMFPTIFALAIFNLGKSTKQGGSFLIMSIVGGAVIPPLMGFIADRSTTSFSYGVPLICFFFVLFYGMRGYRVR